MKLSIMYAPYKTRDVPTEKPEGPSAIATALRAYLAGRPAERAPVTGPALHVQRTRPRPHQFDP